MPENLFYFVASDGDYFSLSEIESNIQPAVASDKRKVWGTKYRNGITQMELALLEKTLVELARSPTDDHRWDLSFLTPTYRHVRAKVSKLTTFPKRPLSSQEFVKFTESIIEFGNLRFVLLFY